MFSMIVFMNRLPTAKRAQILSMLCEGNSMRSVSRLTNVSINTVSKLLVDAGLVGAAFHDENVRGLKSMRLQLDEIWAFVGAKEKHATAEQKAAGWGDCWTFTALDADSKMLVSFMVGPRSVKNCFDFVKDLAGRVTGKPQITTDGFKWYEYAIEDAFGIDVDYAVLQKHYATSGGERTSAARYSPAHFTSATKEVIRGNPNPKHISTSFVERANLTMRMHMRRFTRLTNGFSKKMENHSHMVALYTVWYNWMKVHKSLRVTPAMEAGLTDRVFEMADLAALIEQSEAPQPANLSHPRSA